mgnify:CR=1 FL=1
MQRMRRLRVNENMRSLGRKEVNDRMRPFRTGKGSRN